MKLYVRIEKSLVSSVEQKVAAHKEQTYLNISLHFNSVRALDLLLKPTSICGLQVWHIKWGLSALLSFKWRLTPSLNCIVCDDEQASEKKLPLTYSSDL